MGTIFKTLILVSGLAIILPLAYADKLLHWLPPYGVNPANVSQSAGAKMARLSTTYSQKNLSSDTAPISARPEDFAPANMTENSQPEEKKFVIPGKPYRILLVGDSFMAVSGGFGDILEQKLLQFNNTAVMRKGKVSSGLSRPDFYDWHLAAENTITSFKPNIAIIMMGTNDAQSFEVLENQKKQVIDFGTAGWDRQYQSRSESFIKEFTDNGSIVYWIGLPAMRAGIYDAKIKRLSKLQEIAAGNNPQAKFISSAKLMSEGQIAYQPFMPDEKGIMRATRNPDGIHLSYYGGNILVDKIIEEIEIELDLAPSAPQPINPQ